MSWSAEFSGVGAAAKREAQRKLRGQRGLVGAGQEASPHNATIDAVVGVVAMLATQYPDSRIMVQTHGHLDWDRGGEVQLTVRIAPATEADRERDVETARRQRLIESGQITEDEPTPKPVHMDNTPAPAGQPAAPQTPEAKSGTTQNRPTADAGNAPVARQPGGNANAQPTSAAGNAAVGQRSGADEAGGKPGSGTKPSNA